MYYNALQNVLTYRKGITLSGRIASGHTEPTFTTLVNLAEAATPSGPSNIHQDGMYYASGHCQNCTNVSKNAINLNNSTQPFIWALGAKYAYPDTSSKSGPLKVHDMYGYFSVDMLQIMGGESVPALGTTMENAVGDGVVRYLDFGNNGHGAIMAFTFVFIFPLGVVVFRLFEMIRLHIIFQTIGTVLAILGAILGIIISTMYHRSMDFLSPHQLIGLVVVSGIIVQWIGGMMHHRYFVRYQRPWMKGIPINIHKMALGFTLIAAGLVNAAIGWDFALIHKVNYVYIPVAGGMILLAAAALILKPVIQRRYNRSSGGSGGKKHPLIGPPQPIEGFGDRYSTMRSAIPLGKLASLDPALYDAEAMKPRNML